MDLQHIISVPLLADLKTIKGNANSIALLLGGSTVGDGMGGLYMWVVGNIGSESLTYMDKIAVTNTSDGYWSRIFLRTTVLPHGVLIRDGQIKRFYSTANYVTDANGECSINLTLENTPTGTPIFSEIWWNDSRIIPPTSGGASANDAITGHVKVQASNLKTTTHTFTRGNNQSFGIGIAITVLGRRTAPAGQAIQFRCEGV